MMLSQGEPSYTCPFCGRTSYNPTDVKERYCGACHLFSGGPVDETDELRAQEGLQRAILRGSEPYWMQDIRLAQRRIDSARRARSQGED